MSRFRAPHLTNEATTEGILWMERFKSILPEYSDPSIILVTMGRNMEFKNVALKEVEPV